MEGKGKGRPGAGFVIGLLVMTAGVLLLLGMFGYALRFRVEDYWPVLLIVIGLEKMVRPRQGSQIFWGILWVLVGVLFQLKNLGWLSFHTADLTWPILLVIIGYYMARGSIRKSLFRHHRRVEGGTQNAERSGGSEEQRLGDLDEIDIAVNLGGGRYTYLSKKLKGGRIAVTMGACVLDLRQADMEGQETTIIAQAVMGGIEIKVPPEWEVVMTGTPVMGSLDNQAEQPKQAGKRLVIRGSAFMAGIEVHH